MITEINNWTNILARGCDKSVDGWSETKDMAHWTNLLTLDVLGELCFGENFHASDRGDHRVINLVMKSAILAQKV